MAYKILQIPDVSGLPLRDYPRVVQVNLQVEDLANDAVDEGFSEVLSYIPVVKWYRLATVVPVAGGFKFIFEMDYYKWRDVVG